MRSRLLIGAMNEMNGGGASGGFHFSRALVLNGAVWVLRMLTWRCLETFLAVTVMGVTLLPSGGYRPGLLLCPLMPRTTPMTKN